MTRADAPRRIALSVASVLVVIAALVLTSRIAWTSLAAQIRSTSSLPYYDQWPLLRQYIGILEHGLRPSDLWAQWNEHRLVLPRLVFLMDLSLFKGRNAFCIAVSDILLLTSISTMSWLCLRVGFSLIAVLTVFFATAALTSAAQYENFYWGFQVQFIGVYTLALLAFVLGIEAFDERRRGWRRTALIAAALLMALAASLTMANGLFAFFALALVLAARRGGRGLGAATAALGGLVFAIYLFGYQPVPGHTPLSLVAERPIDALRYLLTYLGAIFAPNSIERAQAFGAVLVVMLVAQLAYFVIRPCTLGAAGRIAAAGICFVLMSAVATTLGRFEFGIAQALSPRYVTPGAVLWSLAAVLTLVALKQARANWTLPVVLVLSAGLLRLSFHTQPIGIENMDAHAEEMKNASRAFVVGAHDDTILAAALPDPDAMFGLRPLLLARSLSVFGDKEATWMGRHIADVFVISPGSTCRGGIDSETAFVKGGAAVSGWAWTGGIATTIVLTDKDNVIVGYGAGGYERPDVTASEPAVTSPYTGWRGHVAPQSNRPLSAFAVSSDGLHACPFAQRP